MVTSAEAGIEAVTDDARINQILGPIVHELRNSITMIGGFSQMLAEDKGTLTVSQVHELAGAIRRGTTMIETLIDRLSDVRLLASGTMRIDHAPCDLAAIAREVAAATQAPPAVVTAGEREVEGMFDARRVRQILTALVTNARTHGIADEPIEIRVGRDGADAIVTVADHGAGVQPEIQEAIFESFERHGHRSGLGLGLTVARGIARAHGGDLSCADTPGGGATFTARLPLSATVLLPGGGLA